MKILAKRLNTVGVGLGEFCRTHLNTDYRTFQYRMKTGHYYPAEVVHCFKKGFKIHHTSKTITSITSAAYRYKIAFIVVYRRGE